MEFEYPNGLNLRFRISKECAASANKLEAIDTAILRVRHIPSRLDGSMQIARWGVQIARQSGRIGFNGRVKSTQNARNNGRFTIYGGDGTLPDPVYQRFCRLPIIPQG